MEYKIFLTCVLVLGFGWCLSSIGRDGYPDWVAVPVGLAMTAAFPVGFISGLMVIWG